MKLELSSEGRYAPRGLVYLARDAGSGELLTTDRIFDGAVVSRRLLARVMAKLSRAGLDLRARNLADFSFQPPLPSPVETPQPLKIR